MKNLFAAIAITLLIAFGCQPSDDVCRNCPGVIVDTVETVKYDTLFMVRYDTVETRDTLYITQTDTVMQTIIDTVYITEIDTVFKTVTDTVLITETDTVFQNDTLEIVKTDTVVQVDTLQITETDTVLQVDSLYFYEERTLYATSIDSGQKQYYDIHPDLRNIDWQIVEDSLNAPTFRVRIYGPTGASRIRFASKCIGYDSLMNAIDNRRSMSLEPDTTGFVDEISPEFTCHPPGGNASMNYWLTAVTDSGDIVHRDYIDVAHIRSIGN